MRASNDGTEKKLPALNDRLSKFSNKNDNWETMMLT